MTERDETMRSTLSQSELEERESLSKHPNTPIHIGEEISEEGWKRFVFFENVKDAFWIAVTVIGFGAFLFLTTAELTKQHGAAVSVSIVVAVLIVLLYSRKKS